MRRTRALAALALAAAVAALGAVPATGAGTTPPGGEATLVAPPSKEPAHRYLYAAGTGLLMDNQRYDGGAVWKSLKDGREAVWGDCDGSGEHWYSGDSRACPVYDRGTHEDWAPMAIHDFVSGKTETLPAKADRAWVGTFTPTRVLATEQRTDGQLTLHLIGRETESRKDVVVKTTEKVRPSNRLTVTSMAADDEGSVIWYQDGTGSPRIGLVDYATATLRPLPFPEGVEGPWDMDRPTLSPTRILLSSPNGKATLLSRADLRKLPAGALEGAREGNFLGGWFIRRGEATPVEGGAARTVLPATAAKAVRGSDGNLYVLGGSDAAHWGVHRIALDAHGIPRATKVLNTPPGPAYRSALTFAQGGLAFRQSDGYADGLLGFKASVVGPVSVSQTAAWSCDGGGWADPPCSPDNALDPSATGDGRLVTFGRGAFGKRALYVQDARPGGSVREVLLKGGEEFYEHRIVTASGRYLLFKAYGDPTGQQLHVADIDAGKLLPAPDDKGPAALWGSMLWQPEGDKGVVAGTDLRTGKVTRRVDLGSGCRPYALLATAEWFYSTCSESGGSPAGYHVPTKKRVTLPATPMSNGVQLGDGFVVREHGEAYNLRSGKAVRETAPVELQGADALTVDRFGGHFAYVDPNHTVHIVGITGKASALTAIDRNTPSTGAWSSLSSKRWAPQVWLSKPAASWTMAVTNKATGKVVRTLTGGEVRGLLQPMKDGRESSGGFVLPDGAYTWALKVKPADGQGAELALSGPLTLTGSTAGGGLPAP